MASHGTSDQHERFQRQSNILSKLDHPNIVTVRETGESNGFLYHAVDYVVGTDAESLIKQGGPIPIARAVGLACQMLEALIYLHRQGIVHHDVKPANLLITQSNNQEFVKLIGFDISRRIVEIPEAWYRTSYNDGDKQGSFGGTPAFMAPEQITHYSQVKPPADQYAAAATLYRLLTAHFIYDMNRNIQQQLLLILQEKPVPIRSRRKDIPEGLAQVIHRALAREPQERFPDVAAFRQALLPFSQ